MAKRELPTTDQVRQVLDYNPDTGILTWRHRPSSMFAPGLHGRQHQANAWNAKYAGKEAFTAIRSDGYKVGTIYRCMVRSHRVAWTHYYGFWPSDQIDHINGITTDNRISNLRDVPNIENHKNEKRSKNNTSGANGVHWCNHTQKWRAVAKVGYKNLHIGRYDTIEEARDARKQADVRLGFTRRHGD